MSAQDLFAPYLNRFLKLLNQNATAKLEFSCKEGKVNVNISHDLGVVAEASPATIEVQPTYKEALRKGTHFASSSQNIRLQRRAISRAEEARKETKRQQLIAEEARGELMRAKEVAEKAVREAEEAKREAELVTKAEAEAEKAMVSDSVEVTKPKENSTIHKDQSSNNTLPLEDGDSEETENLNESSSSESDTCSWCCIDFYNKTEMKEHKGVCHMCQKEKEPCLQIHNSMMHQEIECDKCKSNLFETFSKLKEHMNSCLKCNQCEQTYKSKKDWNKHKRNCDKVTYKEQSQNLRNQY